MARRRCWNCDDTAVMIPKGAYHGLTDGESGPVPFVASLYMCPGCHFPSAGIARSLGARSDEVTAATLGDQAQWLPQSAHGKDFPNVPEHIAAAADEAHQCFSISAYRGALILARAVVEATCKDKGATGKQLFHRIEKLKELEHISPGTARAAHAVRDLGNDMAHGDFDVEASEKNAKGVLSLMDKILDEVYQTPALLASLTEDTVQSDG